MCCFPQDSLIWLSYLEGEVNDQILLKSHVKYFRNKISKCIIQHHPCVSGYTYCI